MPNEDIEALVVNKELSSLEGIFVFPIFCFIGGTF